MMRNRIQYIFSTTYGSTDLTLKQVRLGKLRETKRSSLHNLRARTDFWWIGLNLVARRAT